VGALIPDEVYAPEMEESALCSEWLNRFPYLNGILHDVDKTFLRRAQLLHVTVAKDAVAFVNGLDILTAASGLNLNAASALPVDYA
jgi:hypothetical protein